MQVTIKIVLRKQIKNNTRDKRWDLLPKSRRQKPRAFTTVVQCKSCRLTGLANCLSCKLICPVLCLKNDQGFKILVRNGKSRGVEVVGEALQAREIVGEALQARCRWSFGGKVEWSGQGPAPRWSNQVKDLRQVGMLGFMFNQAKETCVREVR